MVKVLDKNGQPLSTTTRNGKVRRLLKDKKARVVNMDPFTIQLLYDVETEEFTMNRIIVTNDTRIPKDIMTVNTKIMDYSTFNLKIHFIDLMTFELYFDVDGLDINTFEYIKGLNLTNVTYFKFDNALPIEEPILKVSAFNPIKEVNRDTELDIKLSNDLTIHGSTLIAGKVASGKTTLLNNIMTQLKSKDVEVVFASPVPAYDSNCHITDVKALAELTSKAQHEMMDRFKVLEQEQVNYVYKLKTTYFKTKIIIIDEFSEYMISDDHESVDTIKSSIGSLLRLGRATGIMLIIACQRPSSSVVSAEMFNSIRNGICMGPIDDDVFQLMFKDSINIHIPYGMGICKVFASNYSVFNIDDVKNFK